jgi:ribosomal protein L7/L12
MSEQDQKNTPPNPTPTEFKLPDEFKDKGWAKSIKSFDDLVKGYDGAISLIGKRQKPESAEAYDFEVGSRSADEVKALKGMLFESGVSNEQAKKLIENLDKTTKAYQDKIKGDDAQLEAQLVSRFGANYDVLKNKTQDLVSKLMPTQAESLKNMNNTQIQAFIEVINHYESAIKGLTKEDGKDYFDDNPFSESAQKAKKEMKELYERLGKIK